MYQQAPLTWVAKSGQDIRRLAMMGRFTVLGSDSPMDREGKSLDKCESVDEPTGESTHVISGVPFLYCGGSANAQFTRT